MTVAMVPLMLPPALSVKGEGSSPEDDVTSAVHPRGEETYMMYLLESTLSLSISKG